MKKTIKFSFILLSLIFSLSSCMKDDFDTPALYESSYTGDKSNLISIDSLKAKYTSTTGLQLITDSNTLISGIVVGNDESGNIYKALEIQDATGGIEVLLNQTSLYNTYKVGQRVYIKCAGMYLGIIKGVLKLGDNYNGEVGQLASAKIKGHVFLDGFPLTSNIPSAKEITSGSQINDSLLNTLVTFTNVSFANGGTDVYSASDRSTSQTINFADATTAVAYTSNYADFRADSLPEGKGNITGVLTKYVGSGGSTTYEILIRSTSDVTGFVKPILSESFASSLGDFTTHSVTGTQAWSYNSSYTCAYMSGYSSSYYANEDWLISPSLDLSSQTRAYLSFSHAVYSATSADTYLTLWASTDYDETNFSSATWTKLTIPTYPTAKYTFVSSGSIDLSPYIGKSNVHFAFKYVSTTSNANTWEIRNVVVEQK